MGVGLKHAEKRSRHGSIYVKLNCIALVQLISKKWGREKFWRGNIFVILCYVNLTILKHEDNSWWTVVEDKHFPWLQTVSNTAVYVMGKCEKINTDCNQESDCTNNKAVALALSNITSEFLSKVSTVSWRHQNKKKLWRYNSYTDICTVYVSFA